MFKAVLIKAIVYTVSNALANMISYSPFVLSLYFKDEVYVFLVNEVGSLLIKVLFFIVHTRCFITSPLTEDILKRT